jgi:transposase InsO family protein
MWSDAQAFPEATQCEVIQQLRKREADEGVPDALWSDRGMEFVGRAVQAYLKDKGVAQRTTTSRNHQGAGAIEAHVKKLKDQLAKRQETDNQRWDLLIDPALMNMTDAVLSDLKTSPFELRYGKKMKRAMHPHTRRRRGGGRAR